MGVLRSKDTTYLITSADVLPTPMVVSMAVLGLEALDGITGEVEEEASRALIEHYGGASGSGGTSLSLDTVYWMPEALAALGREPPVDL
ncbi:MAG: hypothetical protein ACO2OQ_00285, partial [Thermofilaceae archaeon]